MNRYLILLSLGIFLTQPAKGLNLDKCNEGLKQYYPGPTGLTSTTQFTSSFGGCSALSQAENSKKYVSANETNLKQEIAIGNGEYLIALDEALLCPLEKQTEFNKSLQKKTPILGPLESDSFYQEIIATADAICSVRSQPD